MRRSCATVCALCLAALPPVAGAYAFFGQPNASNGGPQPLQIDGTPVVWPDGKTDVAITLNFDESYRDSALDAMRTGWNAAGTPLQFSEGTTVAQPCRTSDGVNVAGWRMTTCDGSSFGDALAVTLVTHTRRSGRWEISDTDIIVNSSRQPWSAHRSGPFTSVPYDFHRIFMHELGHALGLEHPDEADQTVTAIMNSRVSDIETLQDDDIDGINYLYGDVDTRTNTRNQSDSGGADGALAVLALLGWGARAFARRGRRVMMRIRWGGQDDSCC